MIFNPKFLFSKSLRIEVLKRLHKLHNKFADMLMDLYRPHGTEDLDRWNDFTILLYQLKNFNPDKSTRKRKIFRQVKRQKSPLNSASQDDSSDSSEQGDPPSLPANWRSAWGVRQPSPKVKSEPESKAYSSEREEPLSIPTDCQTAWRNFQTSPENNADSTPSNNEKEADSQQSEPGVTVKPPQPLPENGNNGKLDHHLNDELQEQLAGLNGADFED